MMKKIFFLTLGVLLLAGWCSCEVDSAGTVEDVVLDADFGESREASRTDADAVARESDSLTADQLAALRDNGDAFTFQTEVSRVMKLIINSLYRNKEIFLRELISNASDALDKIRLLSLTDSAALDKQSDLVIRIKADKENMQLHIEDTGIGMTKQDLVNNLGTIAKSGTADFLSKMQENQGGAQDLNDMIGQFGVGFYSAFLVAERVTVTSKNNDDIQHVWTSDADKFSVAQDPRGNTLDRGTRVTLHLKQEAADYLQPDTIKNLVKKYSQFINFPIYLWASREETITVDEEDTDKPTDEDDDAQVEEVKDEEKKSKTSTRTVWEWQLMNDNKPLWTRKPTDVQQEEYDTFYRALTRDKADPLAYAHFVAEGEVSFRALLFVPKVQPAESFNRYGTRTDNIKLYVRRVFISDEFSDLMPNYLAFIQGIVDSDDLPLNMSRETLQQHKLMKIIKKKLVRKVLDMLKKIPADEYHHFWKEYSTNIKLGVMEDPTNRSRLAKLLMFYTSNGEDKSFLSEYVSRMKPKQEHIYYVAGASKQEVQRSPFAERLVAKGYEVLYLTEPVDEYCISSLPEYDGKKFQNVAKEMFSLDEDESTEAKWKELQSEFEPLTTWMGKVLGEYVTKVQLSKRLSKSPAALVATMFGWSGNMERLAMSNAHQKADDAQRKHHLSQKKVLEINPRHPLIAELLRRASLDQLDAKANEAVLALHRTAALRSGFMLHEGQAVDFANSVEKMLHAELGIDVHAQPEEEAFEREDEPRDEQTHDHEEL